MRRFLALTAIILMLGAAIPGVIAAQEATPSRSSSVVTWSPCGDGWECGTIAVPLDYNNPAGETVDLAITRMAASDPSRRIGSLFVSFGGPGATAVSTLHEIGAQLFPEDIRAHFDLVGFDPRGVGDSHQLDCQIDLEAYYAIDPSPDSAAEQEAQANGARDFAASCAANGGDLLATMGTNNVIQDMEQVRIALGEETISYLGLSYGTSIGARYADRYPDRVRAFALDAVLPTSIDGATLMTQWAAGYEQSFNAFLADCSSALTCPFRSGGDAGAAYDRLMQEIDSAPLAVEGDPRPVGQNMVLAAIDGTLWSPPQWPQLATALASATAGDGSAVLELADQRNDRREDGTYSTAGEVFAAVACLDYPFTTDPAAYQALAAKVIAAAPRTGAFNANQLFPCVFWSTPPAPAATVPAARGAAPILVVGATVDTQDPYVWAVDLATQLDSGVLLTRDGTGHVSYLHSQCAYEAINTYLLDLTLPAPGAACPTTGGLLG